MTDISRRKLIVGGIAAAAGLSGLAAAARIAQDYGLIPPDHRGLYGAGETLTYASMRLLNRHSMAREFSRDQISKRPVENEIAPLGEAFKRLQDAKFSDWRLQVDGMVERPTSFTISQLQGYPSKTQITELACEEGWSYVAEWNGVPLSHVLDLVGSHPQARYVVYRSFQSDWMDSMDMADALHPQTYIAYGFNGNDLPVPSGGPLRMRVPRQLGYKSVKFINHITVTDDLKKVPGAATFGSYAWYAGI
jgi:DMSO/TMAO reductase YedYZ molybdopterin-dependent catalytic subunit